MSTIFLEYEHKVELSNYYENENLGDRSGRQRYIDRLYENISKRY